MGVHRFILPLSSIPLSSASFFSLRTITRIIENGFIVNIFFFEDPLGLPSA